MVDKESQEAAKSFIIAMALFTFLFIAFMAIKEKMRECTPIETNHPNLK